MVVWYCNGNKSYNMKYLSFSILHLASSIRPLVAVTAALPIVFSCLGQRNTNQANSLDSPLDSTQAMAYKEFRECISVVDSNIHAWSKIGNLGELTPISMEGARSCIIYTKRASEYAMKAFEIIAPYDSTLCEPAKMISEFADLGSFYANSYLEGKGEAYAAKCQVQAGHAATFLQDIKKTFSNGNSIDY